MVLALAITVVNSFVLSKDTDTMMALSSSCLLVICMSLLVSTQTLRLLASRLT